MGLGCVPSPLDPHDLVLFVFFDVMHGVCSGVLLSSLLGLQVLLICACVVLIVVVGILSVTVI